MIYYNKMRDLKSHLHNYDRSKLRIKSRLFVLCHVHLTGRYKHAVPSFLLVDLPLAFPPNSEASAPISESHLSVSFKFALFPTANETLRLGTHGAALRLGTNRVPFRCKTKKPRSFKVPVFPIGYVGLPLLEDQSALALHPTLYKIAPVLVPIDPPQISAAMETTLSDHPMIAQPPLRVVGSKSNDGLPCQGLVSFRW